MKTIFFFFFFLFFLNNSFSQQTEFVKRYDWTNVNVEARDMLINPENGVLVVGHVDFSTSFIANLDQNGTINWSKQFQNPANNLKINKVVMLKDSSFVAVGSTYNSLVGRYGALCIRFNGFGDTIWVKSVDNNSTSSIHACDVIQLEDSSILITGQIEGENSFAINLDDLGNKIWGKSYLYDPAFSPNIFKLLAVKQDNNQDLVFCGGNGLNSGLIMKTDVNGNIIDSKTFSSNYDRDFADLLIEDSSYVFLNGNGYAGLLKTDFSLNIQWDKVYLNLFSFENNPSEYRKNFQLTQLFDSTLVLGGNSDFGGYILSVNQQGEIVQTFNAFGQTMKAVQSADSSVFFLMNGPLIGVKSNINKHFGIVKVDGMNFQTMNFATCFQGTNSIVEDVVSSSINNLVLKVNNINVYNTQMIINNTSLIQGLGCVDQLGGITENIDSQFTVFPNPFANEIIIERTKNDMEYYEILDYSGRIILKGTIIGVESIIQTTNLENGYYFIKIGNSSKSILKIN